MPPTHTHTHTHTHRHRHTLTTQVHATHPTLTPCRKQKYLESVWILSKNSPWIHLYQCLKALTCYRCIIFQWKLLTCSPSWPLPVPYLDTLTFFLLLEGQAHSFCMTFASSYLCASQHNWFVLMMHALAQVSPFCKQPSNLQQHLRNPQSHHPIFSIKITVLFL